MTISTVVRIATYIGNGAITAFAFPVYFIVNEHVQVYKKLTADVTWNLLAYGTDYTLTGAGNLLGGTVTMTVAPLGTESLMIARTVDYTQGLNLVANDDLTAEGLELALDKLTMADQQLDARIGAVEAAGGVPIAGGEPFIFVNNAILALKNTITQNAFIPAGFNALAIDPTISIGVSVTVAPGSVFVSLDPGGGGGPGGGALLTTNVFSGRQDFGTPSGTYVVRIDPAYGDMYVNRSAAGALPVNTFTLEQNAFAGDVQVQSGTDTIAVLHGIATSKATQNGVVTGVEGIAVNATDKSGAGLGAQLWGGIFIAQNQVFNHTAGAGAGVYVQFRNRTEALTTPVNGTPGATQGYGKNFAGIYIDAQARGSVVGIPCGWQTGIKFSQASLDRVTGGALAVGIDMTAFDLGNVGPEGAPYGSRIQSCIALPTGYLGINKLTGISWSTDKLSCQTFWRDIGTWEIANNGALRFAFATSTGVMYAWGGGGYSYAQFLDLVGSASNPYLMSFSTAGGKVGVSPVNGTTPIGWVRMKADAADVFVPLYA
jgi:hypothetical protein